MVTEITMTRGYDPLRRNFPEWHSGGRRFDPVQLHQTSLSLARPDPVQLHGVGESVRPFTVHLPVDGGGVPT